MLRAPSVRDRTHQSASNKLVESPKRSMHSRRSCAIVSSSDRDVTSGFVVASYLQTKMSSRIELEEWRWTRSDITR